MSSKSYTLKQLRDVIHELVIQKELFDQRCIQNKQPMETYEEFMYTFLNQKYGLRSLTVTYAHSII